MSVVISRGLFLLLLVLIPFVFGQVPRQPSHRSNHIRSLWGFLQSAAGIRQPAVIRACHVFWIWCLHHGRGIEPYFRPRFFPCCVPGHCRGYSGGFLAGLSAPEAERHFLCSAHPGIQCAFLCDGNQVHLHHPWRRWSGRDTAPHRPRSLHPKYFGCCGFLFLNLGGGGRSDPPQLAFYPDGYGKDRCPDAGKRRAHEILGLFHQGYTAHPFHSNRRLGRL